MHPKKDPEKKTLPLTRHSYSYDEKADLISSLSVENPKTYKSFAKEKKIKLGTLKGIMRNKNKIVDRMTTGLLSGSREKDRPSKHDAVDEALLIWFLQEKQIRPGKPISPDILLQFANEFGSLLELNWIANSITMSFISNWKRRHGIQQRKQQGEAAAVDLNVSTKWKEQVIPKLLSSFQDKDVLNVDELGLFWKLLPDSQFVLRGQKVFGEKQPKSRVTILLAAFMDGTRLPPLVIGQVTRPHVFRHKTLPCEWTANTKGWMTSSIFQLWLDNLDRKMTREKRKIAVVLDNFSGHFVQRPESDSLAIIFLPPNQTPVLQPLDAGIIKRRDHERETSERT
jgi:hypothetical protein